MSSLVEKLARFDIRFKIINPKLSTEKIRVNLHIDMEAQKSYRPSNPSYPILKRAAYYVARDLSSQLSTITQNADYSKLEKCYSIWICAEDVPKKLQNTLTEYSFSKKDIIGMAEESEEDYDLLTVIMIRQGKEPEEKGMILGTLMSGKTPEEVSEMLNLTLEEIKKVQEQQTVVNK